MSKRLPITLSRKRLDLERLEPRQLLDGQGFMPMDDVASVRQNADQTRLDVLANDKFDAAYTGPGRISSVSFGSEGGRIEITPDGLDVLYTPPADYAGVETFSYAVDGVRTATVSVSIASPLRDDSFVTPPDGVTRSLDVLANDPFFTGYEGPGRITSVSVGSRGGVVEIAPDGEGIEYTPAADPVSAGTKETFVYVVDDRYAARVEVQIPDPLGHDRITAYQFGPTVTIPVLANDPFYEGYDGPRRITAVYAGSPGTSYHPSIGVVGAAYSPGEFEIGSDDRSVVYTPPQESTSSYQRIEYITYVVDGVFEETIQVDVFRPVQDDRFEVDSESTGFYFNVTQNDRFGGRNRDSTDVVDVVTAVDPPESGGSVTISADGRGVLYTPAPGFTGIDRFTYTADGVHKATVTVEVTRPVRDDNYRGRYDGEGGLVQDTPRQVLAVLDNDFLGNGYAGPRRITSVGPTDAGATVEIAADGRTLLYTPAPGFVGEDRFTYTVDDGLTASVEVGVFSLARDDYDTVRHYTLGSTYWFNVLRNDRFDRGYAGPARLTSVELVSGDVDFTHSADGVVRYTFRAQGQAVLRYVVDGVYEGELRVGVPSQAAPDLVVVDQNSGSTSIDPLGNDFKSTRSSYSGGPRLLTSVSGSAAGGVVSIGDDGRTIDYTSPEDFTGVDTFTYTVDGFWTATVTVQVIRRVRDDVFRVDANDGAESLPVLVNDLFGADYAGQGVLTGVTAGAAGAAIEIGPAGKTIRYTPAPGFTGTDTFTYTVDGVLKAEVSVVVDAPADELAPKFADADEYLEFLLSQALERYAGWFGGEARPFSDLRYTTAFDSTSNRGYSETNVQVEGVDEGDLVEFDADYAYILTADGVTIVDAWPAEELSVASRVSIEGAPVAMYLLGDRLTVISNAGNRFTEHPVDWSSGVLTDAFHPWSPQPTETIVTVLDVSDRAAPTIVQTTKMDGRYLDSRSVDGQVYTLVSNSTELDAPLIIDEDGDPETVGRYETADEYAARLRANRGETLESALPSYTTTGPDGEVVRTGLLHTPETIHHPLGGGIDDSLDPRSSLVFGLPTRSDALISAVSIDATSETPGLSDTTAVYANDTATVFASLDSFYVISGEQSPEDGQITRIAKFDWAPESGGIDFAATTTVPGTIVNQFSVDEHDGELRIATTATNSRSGNWTGRAENLLFVLREDDGVFESIGSIQNWALGESIRSVRFLGDRAFVTTFRNVDPLFALDLSDGSDPRALGHVTLPGFSSYMQLIDENHLLTVGQNTPDGRRGPTQVSLFDISDPTRPLRIAEHTFTRFSNSEAQVDHHAFGYFSEHGLLAMPVVSSHVVREDTDGDGFSETRRWQTDHELAVFEIDVAAATEADRLRLTAEIAHESPVRRSGFIGDKLYSVGAEKIKAVAIDDPATVLAEATLREPHEPTLIPIEGGGPIFFTPYSPAVIADTPAAPPEDPRADAIADARAHLSVTLGVAPGEALLVSSEATPQLPGGGEVIAFRAAGETHWYRIGLGGRFEPAAPGVGFDQGSGVWNAVTVPAVEVPDHAHGDFNGDERVDASDEAIWRASYGSWSLSTYLDADANLDGVVDAADYGVWRDHRGVDLADPSDPETPLGESIDPEPSVVTSDDQDAESPTDDRVDERPAAPEPFDHQEPMDVPHRNDARGRVPLRAPWTLMAAPQAFRPPATEAMPAELDAAFAQSEGSLLLIDDGLPALIEELRVAVDREDDGDSTKAADDVSLQGAAFEVAGDMMDPMAKARRVPCRL